MIPHGPSSRARRPGVLAFSHGGLSPPQLLSLRGRVLPINILGVPTIRNLPRHKGTESPWMCVHSPLVPHT